MTTENLTCPYCNASIAVTPGLTAGQRILCPRCGDSFPLRPADSIMGPPPSTATETAITDRPALASPALPAVDPTIRSRRSLGLFAAMVVGVMLLMAGVGLAFMLRTQEQRRAQDTSRPPRRPGKQRGVPEQETPILVAAVAPDKLAALRYLPSGINFLLAARIPELQANPIGAKLLHDPLTFGGTDYRLEDLPDWVGLRLEDIDHLVFAARIDDAFIPPFYLVFRTAQPYDEEHLRQRLKRRIEVSPGKKKVYKLRLPNKDVRLAVWFADERTVIVALVPDQLQSLPSQPADDLQRLPDRLRTVLQERREPVSPLWIAGHSDDWTKTTAGRFLGRLKKDDHERWAALRSFGLWLVPDETLQVKAVVSCKDAKAAQRLDEYFHALRGPDPQFKTVQGGPWLTMQLQTDPGFLSRLNKEPRTK